MKRKSLIAISIIGAIFLIINAVWFAYWCSFLKYKKAVGYSETSRDYTATDSQGYRYNVFAPEYLSFSGNLTINNVVIDDENTENKYSLFIWPSFLGADKYGIRIFVPVDGDKEGSDFVCFDFMVDEEGKPESDEELTADELKVFEDGKDDIELLFEKANAMWGFGEAD